MHSEIQGILQCTRISCHILQYTINTALDYNARDLVLHDMLNHGVMKFFAMIHEFAQLKTTSLTSSLHDFSRAAQAAGETS